MIENLLGIFDNLKSDSECNSNYEMFGGNRSSNRLKKTKLLLYDMVNTNSDSISDSKLSNNHMKTLFIPLPNANTITVGIFIKAGSRHETEAYGIAHFLEHMTFKGTIQRSSDKLMEELDSIGANYNAMTGHEFTLYYISGDPRDTMILLDIVIDLYLNPIYPDDDIKKEINVVLEELKMNEDNNNRKLSNLLFKNIFEGLDSTLSRPIIGFKETISKFNRDDIINYRKKNYIGSNCLLCISGNYELNDTIKFIGEKFNADLVKQDLPKNLFYDNIINNPTIESYKKINKSMNRYVNFPKEMNQTIINFVFNTYNSYNNYNNSVDLLCDILSSGFSSRLFNLLRTKIGFSYYNNSYTRSFNDYGQMIITVGVDPKSVVKTIKGILDELKNIRDNKIKDNELSKSKKQNETGLLFQFKDPYEYLMYYGMRYLFKKPLYNLSEMLNQIDSVTMDNMNDVIHNVLQSDNLLIGIIGKVSIDDTKKINQLIESF